MGENFRLYSQGSNVVLQVQHSTDSSLCRALREEVIYESSENKTTAVAQEEMQVVHLLEGQWFDPRLLQAVCQNILGQDTEPHIVPKAVAAVSE